MRWTHGMLIFALVACIMFFWWEHRKTLKFCDRVYVGMPYKNLEALFLKTGNGDAWKHQYKQLMRKSVSDVYVSDPSTFGNYACKISHNGDTVLGRSYGAR